MTVAKGRSNCKAERDIVSQGFYEQLQILEASNIEQSKCFKARLYDIITDYSISEEERSTQKNPWELLLQESEESHIRIRRSMFIGLYSFWEVSLKDIVETYTNNSAEKGEQGKKQSSRQGAKNYIKHIYGNDVPELIKLMNTHMYEFRNYLVHGSLDDDRESEIDKLRNLYPALCIKKGCGCFYISDYKGLRNLLELISRELDNAENKALELKNNQNTK